MICVGFFLFFPSFVLSFLLAFSFVLLLLLLFFFCLLLPVHLGVGRGGVDAKLETARMHVVGQRLHARGVPGQIDLQLARGVVTVARRPTAVQIHVSGGKKEEKGGGGGEKKKKIKKKKT